LLFFFFNDTPPTEIYTLSLHDALPISYTTWLSGTALLVVVYWLRAQSMMIDASVVILTPWQAVGIGAASMAGSWIVYDALCRSPLGKNDTLLGVVIFGLLSLLAWGLHQAFG